jgi:DNA-directed RNA polymerase specialized sigma24 family protein
MPSSAFATTDEQLSAELRKWTGATPALHPVGELLDRHWEAAFAYARLCTDGSHPAGMLTTAAFTRLFGQSLRQSGPTAAWRPQLLVTVRRIAAEWSTDHRQEMLHPDLRAAAGDGDRIAARLLPPTDRRLLSRAFQRLPQTARALLWHAEVEAEPLAAPGRLLGLDEEDARVELRRARERLREECLQAHRELAPEQDCLRYFRLLDVTYRRGGVDIDPDLREHLGRCTHCRYTADQLAQFNTDLGTALAEGVLGWGARAYREVRLGGAGEAAPEETGQMPAAAPAEDAPRTPLGGEAFAPGAPAGGEAFTPDAPPAAPVGGQAFMPDASDVAAAVEALASTRSVGPGVPAAPVAPGAPVGGEPFAPAPSDGPGIGEPFAGEPFASAPSGPPSGAGEPLTSATGTASTEDGPATVTGHRPAPAPGSRAAARRSAQKAARRAARHRNLAIAVATVSGLVVLPLVLWSVLGSGDGPAPGGDGQPSDTPGSGTSASGPSWVGAGTAGKDTLRGRLHNVASGLCVGVVGKKAVQGAETELTTCSATPSQQWVYETDGLLRNGAAPGLCLDSHLGYSVQLAPCTGASRPGGKDIRYDFTLQGTLVPRFDQNLALTPAATDGGGSLVLKTRAKGDVQRWVIDTSQPDLQMEVVNWDADADSGPTPRPPASPTPEPSPKGKPPSAPAPTAPASHPAPQPTPSGSHAHGGDGCSYGYPCSGSGQHGWGYGGYGYGGYGYGGYGPYGNGGR